MTITSWGMIGIDNPFPSEALSIGPKLNMHIGANYDCIGYNEYINSSSTESYTTTGYASCLKFRNEWNQTGLLIAEPN